jgi:hypothetical protein
LANAFDKYAALSGPLVIVFFFIMLPAGAVLPPISPGHTADQIVDHYKRHETGFKGGIVLMTMVGFFMPFYVGSIGGQIARIPGVSSTILNTQLIGGTIGSIFLLLPCYLFAVTMYRLERSPELTLLLSDFSWIFFAMPFTGLLAQDFALYYAILMDRRPDPLFPRWLAYFTTLMTLTFWPAAGTHCVRHGAVAWNGALSFWTAGVGGGLQIITISWYVYKAALKRYPEEA